ncbi:MAG: tetratricopeptide repeat protein [Candidatus Zixiibacteriota bacterium]
MHRCCLCPEHQDITDFHHIILISEGGPDSEDNLIIVCPTCHAKIHRIRGRYTPTQLKMYKEKWVNICALRLTEEEQLKQAPGIILDSLHNQTPPEPNFVGRNDMLKTIIEWYNHPKVRVGALIGWGGVGKSALVRKWYDSLEENKIQPDGIFWWGFYRNAYLDQFLNALLRYVSQGEIDPDSIKSTWEKIDKIKECISKRAHLIILDGLEQMQKSESGDEFGKMLHRECTELLHYLADAPKTGLCLITTRFPLKDLDNWCEDSYRTLPLIDLSLPDAIAMLRKRGVKGDNEELKDVIERYKGHALSLTSVAGYLKRYYGGDIKHGPDIKFVFSEKERFKDVNKLLHRYAEKMTKSELVFLNIFSLFRKEVTENEFRGVLRHKIEDSSFNDMLVKMSKLDFKDLVEGLVNWRLISYDETKNSYSTHHLIKAYFETSLDEKDERLCHKRIYQYFGENASELPETLEEMQPLFEQVFHGCSAGLYDEVFYYVYLEKIIRREEYFLTAKLGAWETNLSLLRNFFPIGELSQLPLVSRKSYKSWLLNEAGLSLLNTGRPKEAEYLFCASVQMDIAEKDWRNASIRYQNLVDLQFRTGEIKKGLESAKRSLEMAEKASSNEDSIISKAYLGHILHLLDKIIEAEKSFREADELERKRSGFGLHSIYGAFYADFLISNNKIEEASELTRQNLKICQDYNWINDIPRCHRCLGAIERIKGNPNEAEAHLQKAYELARKVGMPYLEIETLLDYGRLYLEKGEYRNAINAGNEVLKICQRTGFLLYEPDAEMILAKTYLAQKDFAQAKTFANSALSKAQKMSHKLAEIDAENVLKEIKK